MPLRLEGGCRCAAVRFAFDSHAPQPYQLCYCGICRKTAGGGGFAINLLASMPSLTVEGSETLAVYRAVIETDAGCKTSTGERHFCSRCASALWLYDPSWPDLVHPFASAVDTPLPIPPERVHMMIGSKADWVEPQIGPRDRCFDTYPEESIEDWHKSRRLWIE